MPEPRYNYSIISRLFDGTRRMESRNDLPSARKLASTHEFSVKTALVAVVDNRKKVFELVVGHEADFVRQEVRSLLGFECKRGKIR